MQSTGQQSSIPDRSREQRVPPTEDIASIDRSNASDSSRRDRVLAQDEPWKPNLDRRQSWSSEDRKHQLQGRLMEVVQGQEPGFTEVGCGR